MARISPLEAVKIQARAIIPVVKALEAEFGVEKAHALVGSAIAESWADFVVSRGGESNTHPGRADSGDFPVESEVVEETETTFGRNMTRCAFADYFREIGQPEIGALTFTSRRRLRRAL